jgi:hypothetical protein
MTEIGLIRYASGDWTPGDTHVRVRIEADELEEPQDLSIALGNVGAFVTLLLALSAKGWNREATRCFHHPPPCELASNINRVNR